MLDEITCLSNRRAHWRRLITVLAAVTLGLGAAMAVARPAAADTYLGPWRFVNGASGLCVDNQSDGMVNGNPIQQLGCNGSHAQLWIYDLDTGTLSLFGLVGLPPMCLDVPGSSTNKGTFVQLYQCNGTGAQVWHYVDGQLINPESQLCLDNPDGQNNAGNRMRIWSCNGSPAQQWSAQ